MPVAIDSRDAEVVCVGRLLEHIATRLERGPLDALVAECDAAVVRYLERQTRKTEPGPPSRRELLALQQLLASSGPHERTAIMREIRRVLGRLAENPS